MGGGKKVEASLEEGARGWTDKVFDRLVASGGRNLDIWLCVSQSSGVEGSDYSEGGLAVLLRH